MCLHGVMASRVLATPRKSTRTTVGRATRDQCVRIGRDVRDQRLDAGLSIRTLAQVAEISPTFLSQIERGLREPSVAVLVAIASALGGDLRVRLYPGTGTRIRDPIQSRITEALLAMVHPRWRPHLEVPVYRPVRGVIDLVLHEPATGMIGATEIQSELRRLEQQLRWAHEKADALPSASMWASVGPTARVDRILVLRNTHQTRAVIARFAATVASEYPASSADAYRALTTPDAPWPGSTLLWATVSGDAVRILETPPRGIGVGR